MTNRKLMYKSAKTYFTGKIAYHKANAATYLNNPVAIGEHGDIMEELEKNIGLIADYEDKLETLIRNFEKEEEKWKHMKTKCLKESFVPHVS